MKKICSIMTRAISVKTFMTENLIYMSKHGYKCYIVCPHSDIFSDEDRKAITFIDMKMERGNVSPFEVIRCVKEMYKIFKHEKFDIINYASSNAGLYASIAGWLARVPVRVYCQWGISYETDYTGLKRMFFKFMEYITCLFSTSVQPDSYANLKYAISEHLYPEKKGEVIYNGSATGIDFKRFDLAKKSVWRKEIREQYHIPEDAIVFGFVGRLVPQKGIDELIASYLNIRQDNVYLLLVGHKDELDNLNRKNLHTVLQDDHVAFTGSVLDPERYHAAFDFFMLPSYREGFGLVVLEAAALKVPSVISNIKGPTDFIKDGYNGLVCDVMSVDSLTDIMKKALGMTKEDYNKLAQSAYDVAKRDFDSEDFKRAFLENRNKLLEQVTK